MDYHAGGKWFIQGPKRHKENQLLSLKHPFWLSLVKHVNTRSIETCSVRYSKSKVRGQKHPWEMVKNRNSIPNKSIHNKQRLSTSGRGQPVPEKGRPPQAIPSPISRHNYMLHAISRIQRHSYIYTLVQTIISVQAKLEVVRRKHIVHPTGFSAYSSTCCKGTDSCAGTIGVDQLSSSTVGL